MPSHITSALYCHCCCTKGAPGLCWREMAFWTQLGLLLWKNFTYRRRQTVSISQRGFWGLSCSPVGWSSAEWGNVLYLNVLPLVVPGRATGSAFGKTRFKLKRVVGGQKPEGSKVIKTSVVNPNMRVRVLKRSCQTRQRGCMTAVCSKEDMKWKPVPWLAQLCR